MISYIRHCRICKSKDIKTFFNLGMQPLANSLLKTLEEKEKFYPLSLSWCQDCNLVQLNETVDPKELFLEYIWVTATSQTARDYAEEFFQELTKRTGNKKQDYVLEVASNDGTFLIPFLRQGYEVLGIDPAKNIVEIAESQGIPTKCLFFGAKTAKELVKEKGTAPIIFARNVLPHVANTRDFVEGLEIALADDGVLAIEIHYAKKILGELHYDSIYHEHLCYFTLKSIERLLNDFHLFIYDLRESPISGGSLIIYAKKYKTKETLVVQTYRNQEKENKVNDFGSWENFANRAFSHREKLLDILYDVSKEKGMVAGYGASARSSTLLNFCRINSNLISIIADQNPLKQKRFTAGSHIPIDSPEVVMNRNPRFVLILAWNFANEIIENLKNKFNYKGGIIVPLPNKPYLKKII